MPLEDVIHQVFIPSLTGRSACSDIERKILALPPRMGGLGLLNPSSCYDDFFKLSVKLTSSLVDLIVQQQLTGEVELGKILTVKNSSGSYLAYQLFAKPPIYTIHLMLNRNDSSP